MGRTAVGVFESVNAAEKARTELVRSGVTEDRIALSGNHTDDDIASEAPGQSYEHQTYGGSDTTDSHRARYGEAVRTGACVLSVASSSVGDCRQLLRLMKREGARVAMEHPD
jgi:hypothetical protein